MKMMINRYIALLLVICITKLGSETVISFHTVALTTTNGRAQKSIRFDEKARIPSALATTTTQRNAKQPKQQQQQQQQQHGYYKGPPLRVVRCFPQFSRREADRIVSAGRVQVDGIVVEPSYRVSGGQTLTLDGQKIRWEARAQSLLSQQVVVGVDRQQQQQPPKQSGSSSSSSSSSSSLEYYKYNKPVGVTCTMDQYDRRGLAFVLPKKLVRRNNNNNKNHSNSCPPSPLFPVGRLDLDSNGLVLLTNDGILANTLLQPQNNHEKEYIVSVRPPLSLDSIEKLASGVIITTQQQRGKKETTARTKPCIVEPVVSSPSRMVKGVSNESTITPTTTFTTLKFILYEGRNRQIRKMIETVGSTVISLQRIRQGVISLDETIVPVGTVVPIKGNELDQLLQSASASTSTSATKMKKKKNNNNNKKKPISYAASKRRRTTKSPPDDGGGGGGW